ncbi:hypothetical protein [Paenibacillus marinisediminis]
MRQALAVMLSLLLMVSLAGCTSDGYTTIGSIGNNTNTMMSMSYKFFDGHKGKTITVKGPTEVSVEVESIKGKLNISIEDENGEYAYQGTDIPTSAFQVQLDQQGKYKLSIDAEDHEGSYHISWKIKDRK